MKEYHLAWYSLRGEVDRVAQELAAATAEYEMADAKVARDQAAADMLHRKAEELHQEALRLAKQWRREYCILWQPCKSY